MLILACLPSAADVPQWTRWEASLESARDHDHPVADVTLRVTCTGPRGRTLRGYGFWDGGRTWRLRAAFPVAGTWRWATDCSDPADTGLHGRQGEVRVTAYRGRNPLYRHGFLRVSDDHRYLCHADGTPFLWIGDTAWAVPFRSKPDDWLTYLDNRVRKRFTLIQVAIAPEWAGERDAQGRAPFIDGDLTRPDPAFWQTYEAKLRQANERGLEVLVVGLMEPTRRYPEEAAAKLFARYLGARLNGDHVLFSPSFDSGFRPLGDAVGEAIKDAAPEHLVTQHPGTPSGEATNVIAEKYHDRAYLDFAGDQSGHNGGNRERCARQAIEWNLHLYHRTPPKPVINLEAMYDAHGVDGWTADDARSLGWRSVLSGAAGYTYGCGDTPAKVPEMNGGIWFWADEPDRPDHWRKAIDWESAGQMTVLHDFLAGIPWWRLEPAIERVHDQPAESVRRVCLAAAREGDLAVAYLPDNDRVRFDAKGLKPGRAARWLDPVHGAWQPAAAPVMEDDTVTYAAPSRGEWVLLLQSRKE
ncbi:MAG: DUF4038 domain-containing protein [Armatimonadetes bacterium]|nr:DUF4038 domain-containing protein [Armatimonadota bacterium]